MSKLVHKSVNVLPEVWQQLKINAELSDMCLRDYLTYLIRSSEPVRCRSLDQLPKPLDQAESETEDLLND